MTTSDITSLEDDLRENLFRRLKKVHNVDTLVEMLVHLGRISTEDVYILTPEEKKMLDEAEAELDAGLGIPHEVVQRDIQEWFNSLKNDSHKDRLK